jgi:signal transduction histidine kinase
LGVNDFIRSNKTQFRYRLTEISDDWSYARGADKIRFFQLPAGDYNLEMQAIALDGHLAPPVFVHMHVHAPYYETWRFRTIFLALVILLSYLAYLYRLKQVLREYTIRQQIADDLHDDIGNKLNIVHILVQKIINMHRENNQIFPEETFKKLIAINRETLQSLRTLIWSVDPKKDRLANLLNRMQDFAHDYLLPLNIHCHFDLPKIGSEKEIKPDVRHHVILIFQELLTNMVKHSSPKEIYVSATVENNNGLELTIENIRHVTSQKYLDSTSGNQGKFSLERRLNKIGGKIRLLESSQLSQKMVLFFPNIFK